MLKLKLGCLIMESLILDLCISRALRILFSLAWSVALRPMDRQGKGNPPLAALDEASFSLYRRTTSGSF